MRNFRPPDSDDEDDYDGFYFGDEPIYSPKPIQVIAKSWQKVLCEHITNDDLPKFKEILDSKNVAINNPIHDGLTVLLYACYEGSIAITEYLVKVRKANVNIQMDSHTPLIMACNSEHKNLITIEQIVSLLIEHGAIVNCSDKYGTTPLMLACKNGFVNIVKRLLNGSNLDAVDNNGNTAIIYAIENNQANVVQLLMNAGANIKILNRKGYDPIQIARFSGNDDLLAILPKANVDSPTIPLKFLNYNTLRDYVPEIFQKSNCPHYFQEICSILQSINMYEFLTYFHNLTFDQFLVLNDTNLKDLGIIYPLHRSKILKGLLSFHLFHWSLKSVSCVGNAFDEQFNEILMIIINHLQHMNAIYANIRFISSGCDGKTFDPLTLKEVETMESKILSYRETIENIQRTTKYLSSFSPSQNPLYIDNEKMVQKRKGKFRWYYVVLILSTTCFIMTKRWYK